MAVFKCKMCGGSLDITDGANVIECEYCGTKQTLPRLVDDRRVNLYDRANHFRRNNEYDKAMGIYEQILSEDASDAEAYWSLVLCRYGIEYVEDPTTHKRVPTVNRAQNTSIFDDENYKSALENADAVQKSVYEDEARAINEIQKGILAISQREEPCDVFICYKESDANGRRTPDSVLAQELYYGLKDEGFKVFFARITLEDKLGSAYEPYIFAALNSAKVMVVLGTRPDYFNAVWVKNEWSRYLALIKQGQKKILIPAYKDMDPYDLPEEFSHLQAQDMEKLGFMQDLIRGIKKLAKPDEPKTTAVRETDASSAVAPLLQRVFLFLEDGEWTSADEYCEKILDIDPECSKAYIGKLMAKSHIDTMQKLYKADYSSPQISKLYDKACRFSNPDEYDLYKSQYGIYEEKKKEEEEKAVAAKTEASVPEYYIGSVKVTKSVIDTARSMISSGQKLNAIKYVKDITGIGLVEAKNWVDNVDNNSLYNLNRPQLLRPNATATVNTGNYNSAEITRLEKKLKKLIIWGVIALIIAWPIGVGLFIWAGIVSGQIKALKEGKPKPNSGCYVATCVYGSYDCPQVWTLRRFRDGTLGATWYGRLFIRIYYAVSPTLVKWFGHTNWFKRLWKRKLDKMVAKLEAKGVENTPYEDKEW